MRETTNNEQAVAAFGRITGPAIIKDVTGIFIHAAATPSSLPIFGIYWNTSPYTSAIGQAAGTRLAGTPLWELTNVNDQGVSALGNIGITAFPGNTITQVRTYPLDVVIHDTELFIACVLEQRSTSGEAVADGSIRVYENCDPADLVALLG